MKIPNPAFNYDTHGQKYSGQRKTDPRIAAYVHKALADSETVINIGAGSGSYEPEDKYLIAVEPSIIMRTQRIANGKIPAINAKADSLPFDDKSFDAAMAMVTVHHWPDIEKGISEIRRVTKKRIVIMTFDPYALDDFWISFHHTFAKSVRWKYGSHKNSHPARLCRRFSGSLLRSSGSLFGKRSPYGPVSMGIFTSRT